MVGYDDDVKELKKTVFSTKESADMHTFVEENEPDYISAMGILGSYAYRVKICE